MPLSPEPIMLLSLSLQICIILEKCYATFSSLPICGKSSSLPITFNPSNVRVTPKVTVTTPPIVFIIRS